MISEKNTEIAKSRKEYPMTKTEILSYLETEDSSTNKHGFLTRLFYSNRHSVFVYFLKKNQTTELEEKNMWVFYSLDNIKNPLVMEGVSISKLMSVTSTGLTGI
jgi:hypothetical protein